MTDTLFMQQALAQAEHAALAGEVPVGAVVVYKGRVVGLGHNAPISLHDPSAHAEVQALRAAAKALGNYRLAECELFATLEPCAMCAGAILHARLQRVVYGAPDLKAGACGSVFNLFELSQLNHHTQVQGGVLAQECGKVLSDFFVTKRLHNAAASKAKMPLRDDALRSPDSAFAQLPGFAWTPRYVADLPSLSGLRQHYIDERSALPPPEQAPTHTYVCLHSPGYWGYAFQAFIGQALQDGARVIVPDMVGFGKSDKPKKPAFHTPQWHRQNLQELLGALEVQSATWVVQGAAPWGQGTKDLLGLGWPTMVGQILYLPQDGVSQDTHKPAWAAPFPDAGHQAGLVAFGCAVLPNGRVRSTP